VTAADTALLRAVLFDAGNTLLFLDYTRMAVAVGAALGLSLSGPGLAAGSAAAARAMERGRAGDRERAAAYLEALFIEAGVPPGRLDEVRDCLARLHGERHLWSGIADDTHDALARLRAAGLRLGVVSNSDGRVEEALAAAGLRRYFDVVIDSTVAGVEKPDPAIFRAALAAPPTRPGTVPPRAGLPPSGPGRAGRIRAPGPGLRARAFEVPGCTSCRAGSHDGGAGCRACPGPGLRLAGRSCVRAGLAGIPAARLDRDRRGRAGDGRLRCTGTARSPDIRASGSGRDGNGYRLRPGGGHANTH